LIVLDNSAALKFLLKGGDDPRIADELEIAVPELIDLEFLNGLRRLEVRREVSPERAAELLGVFFELPLMRFQVREFAAEIWALRHNITPYDAAYVCLARALDAPLLTSDGRLARAAGQIANIRQI
jgi:predicted nucleic acid-binding protein